MEKNVFLKIRESTRLSVEEFAIAVNVSPADVQSWEAGTGWPNLTKFLQICQFATGQK